MGNVQRARATEQPFQARHHVDDDGRTWGGETNGLGIHIGWQNGSTENGAHTETVIEAVINRLEHHQTTRFADPATQRAIDHLYAAILTLETRRHERASRHVLGSQTP